MFSNWAYVLIGDNNTGKTSFQRFLVQALCQESYKRLPKNTLKDIRHPRAPKRLQTLFTANRSFQEMRATYLSPENYFKKFFCDADICILSSHSHGSSIKDVEALVGQLYRRSYNVAGVFWSNGFDEAARAISALPWQERLWIENPIVQTENAVAEQIKNRAYDFAEMLIMRAKSQ
ncbi:hypothetical protein [Bordetella genomosp. 1]|uniref:hypothetical protein n=1 Tax=Bordetella genomosp. 1 TaxID=1395607 RepID=UPI0011776BD7|nr:hypothetical protein [Bordetella genomosp. 1]